MTAIDDALRTMKEAEREIMRLRHALEVIQELLDGKTWTAQVLDDIAVVLEANGYPIKEPQEN